MHPRKLHPMPTPVADLLERVQHWRSTRIKLGRMPQELWLEAARLAKEHGVNAIAGVLRLNYEALRAWTGEPQEGGRSAKSQPRPLQLRPKRREPGVRDAGPSSKQSFVRLDPLAAIVGPSAAIEVNRPDGTKMSVQLTGPTAVDLVGLVDAFLKR